MNMDNYWVSPKKVGLVSEASLKTSASSILVEARLPQFFLMKPFNTNHTFKDIPCIFYPP